MTSSYTAGERMRALMLSLILSLAALVSPALAQEPDTLAHWARVLRNFVNDRGEVDFDGLEKNPADLKVFIDYIARVSPDSDPAMFPTREARLAYHINAYNALAMYNVIDSGRPKSLSGLTKVGVFVFKRFSIGGRSMSLYTYENEVIRRRRARAFRAQLYVGGLPAPAERSVHGGSA